MCKTGPLKLKIKVHQTLHVEKSDFILKWQDSVQIHMVGNWNVSWYSGGGQSLVVHQWFFSSVLISLWPLVSSPAGVHILIRKDTLIRVLRHFTASGWGPTRDGPTTLSIQQLARSVCGSNSMLDSILLLKLLHQVDVLVHGVLVALAWQLIKKQKAHK